MDKNKLREAITREKRLAAILQNSPTTRDRMVYLQHHQFLIELLHAELYKDIGCDWCNHRSCLSCQIGHADECQSSSPLCKTSSSVHYVPLPYCPQCGKELSKTSHYTPYEWQKSVANRLALNFKPPSHFVRDILDFGGFRFDASQSLKELSKEMETEYE